MGMRVTCGLPSWQAFLVKELPLFRQYATILTGNKAAADRTVAAALKNTMRPVQGDMSDAVLQVMHSRILRGIGDQAAKESGTASFEEGQPLVAMLQGADYRDRQAFALVRMLSVPFARVSTIMGESVSQVQDRIDRVMKTLSAVDRDCLTHSEPSLCQPALNEIRGADAESSATSIPGLSRP